MKRKFNPNSETRSAMRRVFSRSPVAKSIKEAARREVERLNKDGSVSKKPKVEYQCACCLSWFSSKEVEVDHIEEVVDVQDGFIDWNTYYERLWCDPSNLQLLCTSCHKVKSNSANAIRRSIKKQNK